MFVAQCLGTHAHSNQLQGCIEATCSPTSTSKAVLRGHTEKVFCMHDPLPFYPQSSFLVHANHSCTWEPIAPGIGCLVGTGMH